MTTHTLTLLLVAGYFVFLVVTLTRRGRVMSGPWLFLLRSFFPNWRFYHGLGHQPRLFVRAAGAEGAWGSWQMFIPRARWQPGQLFHNARHNLTLANQNLVDHLSFDVQTLPEEGDVRTLVTYRLVDRLAQQLLQPVAQEAAIAHYQFQLRLVPAHAEPTEAMTLLVSPALRWSAAGTPTS